MRSSRPVYWEWREPDTRGRARRLALMPLRTHGPALDHQLSGNLAVPNIDVIAVAHSLFLGDRPRRISGDRTSLSGGRPCLSGGHPCRISGDKDGHRIDKDGHRIDW